jgi:hypothetical protein
MSADMSKTGARAPRPKAKEEASRANRSRAVAELLPEVGGVAFRKFGFVQSAVVSRWGEIVGPRYAAVSAPESIRFPVGKRAEGNLTVLVRGAHAPMMQHIAPEIVERVNRFFGYPAVAKVTIRQGELPRAAAVKRPATPAPAPVELSDSLRTIADPELRNVLEALAAGVAQARPALPKVS